MTSYAAQKPPTWMRAPLLRPSMPVAILATMLVAGCGLLGTGPNEATLDRETFIAVYVDLRVTALQEGEPSLTDAERQEILDRHQVTEEQVMEFTTVHGGDLTFMREVWDEIEAELDARRSPAPSDQGT